MISGCKHGYAAPLAGYRIATVLQYTGNYLKNLTSCVIPSPSPSLGTELLVTSLLKSQVIPRPVGISPALSAKSPPILFSHPGRIDGALLTVEASLNLTQNLLRLSDS